MERFIQFQMFNYRMEANRLKKMKKDTDDDEYIEESRCVRCEQEISNEEDINNLGMCNICYHSIGNQYYELLNYE